MITISQVEATDTKWIEAKLAIVQERAATTFVSLMTQKKQDLETAVIGNAGDAAQKRSDQIVGQLERLAAALDRLREALGQAMSRLTNSRSQVLDSVAKLEGQGWGVADNGTVSLVPGSPLAGYAKISPTNDMHVRQLAAEHTVTLKTLLAQFEIDDASVGAQISAAAAGT
ncbi:hypothetical protein [Mycolicibacterium sp. YH-1]|uniref:hypothetical protein n=1 Tax=Mycolicibacterium sp. YH-1 TaxID=2908837 RepID=UPI001F4BCF5D|nr:hypothetical protein [Mycolicibacterium sp. YH-1]UNB51934.1 hypothetical protein L0M16_29325 [Mycolicibacterium sp. YH-1]